MKSRRKILLVTCIALGAILLIASLYEYHRFNNYAINSAAISDNESYHQYEPLKCVVSEKNLSGLFLSKVYAFKNTMDDSYQLRFRFMHPVDMVLNRGLIFL